MDDVKKAICCMLLCVTSMSNTAASHIPVIALDAQTGAQVPTGNYYEDANLKKLTAQGVRKHAPLVMIIDQHNAENPDSTSNPLTHNFAAMFQSAFVPIIVSSSIVYNYFIRRKRAQPGDENFTPQKNPISFDRWHLYTTSDQASHDSRLLIFIPDHYFKHYKENLGFNMDQLVDESHRLPMQDYYTPIIDYIKSHESFVTKDYKIPSLIDRLRSIFTTIQPKQSMLNTQQIGLQELKQQAQLPIWDIILHGHGAYGGDIGGLAKNEIQELLTFFNNELSVGIFYIETCNAGGQNLNLLEFEDTIGHKTLRTLDYIVIVGSISDQPTYFRPTETNTLYYTLYSDAAELQGRSESLNKLLNDLNALFRYTSSDNLASVHGTSNIPQVWLPGGLGFQIFQINEEVQVLGNVKVHAYEDEQRSITIPDTTKAILLYTQSIEVPLLVTPLNLGYKYQQEELIRSSWKDIPSFAELPVLIDVRENSEQFPALATLFRDLGSDYTFNSMKKNAMHLLYPEFISMIRGNAAHYFSKIELQPPQGQKVRRFTGVLNFIRDAFFDIAGRASEKSFFIDELSGHNDISLILELIRKNNNEPIPSEFEMELRPYIEKNITLNHIRIISDPSLSVLQFEFNNKRWTFYADTRLASNGQCWEFEAGTQINTKEYLKIYHKSVAQLRKKDHQKPISETLKKKAAAFVLQHAQD